MFLKLTLLQAQWNRGQENHKTALTGPSLTVKEPTGKKCVTCADVRSKMFTIKFNIKQTYITSCWKSCNVIDTSPSHLCIPLHWKREISAGQKSTNYGWIWAWMMQDSSGLIQLSPNVMTTWNQDDRMKDPYSFHDNTFSKTSMNRSNWATLTNIYQQHHWNLISKAFSFSTEEVCAPSILSIVIRINKTSRYDIQPDKQMKK